MFAVLVVIALVVAWSQAAVRAVRAQAVADVVVLAAITGGPAGANEAAQRNGLATQPANGTAPTVRQRGEVISQPAAASDQSSYELIEIDGVRHAVVVLDGYVAVAAAQRTSSPVSATPMAAVEPTGSP